jgi:hypothetical protein
MVEGRAEDDEERPIRQLIWQREKEMLPHRSPLDRAYRPGSVCAVCHVGVGCAVWLSDLPSCLPYTTHNTP